VLDWLVDGHVLILGAGAIYLEESHFRYPLYTYLPTQIL